MLIEVFRLMPVARLLTALVCIATCVQAQGEIPLQPLARQVRQVEDALNFLGQPLPAEVHRQINKAIGMEEEQRAVSRLQEILDPYVLAVVDINPESRVKVRQGAAKPVLVEQGTRLFLVKVLNQAGVTAPLVVESPNSGPKSIKSESEPEPEMELTLREAKERWADLAIYNKPPMAERLSGLGLEYQVLEAYSHDRGQRSAKISFHVG